MMRQVELVERVLDYDRDADEDLLNRAYVFAMKAHGTQTRASGDPYFSHPIEVAGILTKYKLDTATIATALLHDTLEDTVATYDELESQFGLDVAKLVDGVTKLSKLELQSDRQRQAENFRKLLLAMSDDIRVLLVKLADRLHNMRTLLHIKNEGEASAHCAGDHGDLRAACRTHRHARDQGRVAGPVFPGAERRSPRLHPEAPGIPAHVGHRPD